MHLFGDYEPGVNGSVGSGVNGPELIGIGKNTIWDILISVSPLIKFWRFSDRRFHLISCFFKK